MYKKLLLHKVKQLLIAVNNKDSLYNILFIDTVHTICITGEIIGLGRERNAQTSAKK